MTESTALSHLSIGEVLSLVQEDFPDVTISKIRFLESQGLIAPERTASGYRKFYEADIDRLRWILRQQRDNFLPLKVIKRMLEEGADALDGQDAQPTLWSANTESASPDDTATSPQDGSQRNGSQQDTSRQRATSDGEDDELILEVTETVTARVTERSSSSGTDETPRSASHPAVRSAPRSPSSANATRSVAGAPASDESTPQRRRESAQTRPTLNTPADVVAALQEQPPTPRSARTRRDAATAETPTPPSTSAAAAEVSSTPDAAASPDSTDREPAVEPTSRAAGTAHGASGAGVAGAGSVGGVAPDVQLSQDELIAATGIEADLLAELESYGIIVSSALAGAPTYDAEALQIAHLATRYASLGVEPRHLRMYKVSAEREAGFVEQLIFPLLKQRNPAARQQAEERDQELTRMGAELHAALLRRQIRPLFGN